VVALLLKSLAEEENADQLLYQVARSLMCLPRLNSQVKLSRPQGEASTAAWPLIFLSDLYRGRALRERDVGNARGANYQSLGIGSTGNYSGSSGVEELRTIGVASELTSMHARSFVSPTLCRMHCFRVHPWPFCNIRAMEPSH
jgi:hypothetical protein